MHARLFLAHNGDVSLQAFQFHASNSQSPFLFRLLSFSVHFAQIIIFQCTPLYPSLMIPYSSSFIHDPSPVY